MLLQQMGNRAAPLGRLAGVHTHVLGELELGDVALRARAGAECAVPAPGAAGRRSAATAVAVLRPAGSDRAAVCAAAGESRSFVTRAHRSSPLEFEPSAVLVVTRQRVHREREARAVEHDRFSVALIPHTLQHTTLGELEVGTVVNVETDLVAKYVERLLAGRSA